MLKILGQLLFLIVLAFIASAFFFIFLYLGWNHGIVHAFSFAKPITVPQAFFLNLGFVMVAQALKGVAVTSKE